MSGQKNFRFLSDGALDCVFNGFVNSREDGSRNSARRVDESHLFDRLLQSGVFSGRSPPLSLSTPSDASDLRSSEIDRLSDPERRGHRRRGKKARAGDREGNREGNRVGNRGGVREGKSEGAVELMEKSAGMSPAMSPKSAFPTRDLQGARDAYLTADVEATKRAHAAPGLHAHPHAHPHAQAHARQWHYNEFTDGRGPAGPVVSRGSRSSRGARNSLQMSPHGQIFNESERELLEGHQEAHMTTSGESVKAMIFGGLDGIVTIFAIVAAAVGAKITPSQVMVIGVGNLVACAFSMGFGEYISSKAESDYIEAERRREAWEMDVNPEGEKAEMVEIYQGRWGFSYEDAASMVEIGFRYPRFFLSHMMIEELGLKVEEDEADLERHTEIGSGGEKRSLTEIDLREKDTGAAARHQGVLMFISFGAFGLVPLLGFSVFLLFQKHFRPDEPSSPEAAFTLCCILTLLTLFALGIFKGKFSNQNPVSSGLVMMLNGAIASSVAYGSGAFLQSLISRL